MVPETTAAPFLLVIADTQIRQLVGWINPVVDRPAALTPALLEAILTTIDCLS